jgi:Dolichyl-phosphate-mannose-protein mannosyltransferase
MPAPQTYAMRVSSSESEGNGQLKPVAHVRVEAFLNRNSWRLFFVFTLLATIRIISTYYVFSFTSDEPAHLAAGMQWLDQGTYTYDQMHPPLARVMEATLPYLAGARSQNGPSMWTEGWAILNAGGHHKRTLALARLGNLPFFWLASLMIYLWSRRYLGNTTAVVATFFFALVPGVLAHAGLATTDMALTATYAAAIYTMLVWLERHSAATAIWFGVAVGGALLSKLSAFAFLPATALSLFCFYLLFEHPSADELLQVVKARLRTFAIAALIVPILVWAGYRFSFAGVPAPELFAGIKELLAFQGRGHGLYLLGQREIFWPYYLVDISVKTPLALLILAGAGAIWSWKHRAEQHPKYWLPLAITFAVMAVALYSRMDDGIRHILPIFFPFCMLASIGAQWLFASPRLAARVTASALVIWLVFASVASHPDYLAYFNELAGRHPERILADSDLDWGQDMYRLAERLKQLGATQVAVDPIFIQYPQILHDFPPLVPLNPDAPVPGWNAVSIGLLKTRRELFFNYPRAKPWAERIPPTERVGKSVLLFYVPPPAQMPTGTGG